MITSHIYSQQRQMSPPTASQLNSRLLLREGECKDQKAKYKQVYGVPSSSDPHPPIHSRYLDTLSEHLTVETSKRWKNTTNVVSTESYKPIGWINIPKGRVWSHSTSSCRHAMPPACLTPNSRVKAIFLGCIIARFPRGYTCAAGVSQLTP